VESASRNTTHLQSSNQQTGYGIDELKNTSFPNNRFHWSVRRQLSSHATRLKLILNISCGPYDLKNTWFPNTVIAYTGTSKLFGTNYWATQQTHI